MQLSIVFHGISECSKQSNWNVSRTFSCIIVAAFLVDLCMHHRNRSFNQNAKTWSEKLETPLSKSPAAFAIDPLPLVSLQTTVRPPARFAQSLTLLRN